MSDSKPNIEIEGFEILHPIGAGGMGDVYLAKDKKLFRKVAIKILKKETNEELMQNRTRFLQEARVLASLNHKNIVSIFNFGETKENSYIVMEYVEGVTLTYKIKRNCLTPLSAFRLFKQMVSGMDEVHQSGILHRDLKPSNIIIDKKSQVKIVDFGISKSVLENEQQLTRTNCIIGTVTYLAPELLENDEPSVQSDIFSLGVIFYEMLTGKNPFYSRNQVQVIDKIRNFKPVFPSILETNLPTRLLEIVLKMLEKDRAKRYQNLHEVLKDLERISNQIENKFKDFVEVDLEVEISNRQALEKYLSEIGIEDTEIYFIIGLAAKDYFYSAEAVGKTEDTMVVGDGFSIEIPETMVKKAVKNCRDFLNNGEEAARSAVSKSLNDTVRITSKFDQRQKSNAEDTVKLDLPTRTQSIPKNYSHWVVFSLFLIGSLLFGYNFILNKKPIKLAQQKTVNPVVLSKEKLEKTSIEKSDTVAPKTQVKNQQQKKKLSAIEPAGEIKEDSKKSPVKKTIYKSNQPLAKKITKVIDLKNKLKPKKKPFKPKLSTQSEVKKNLAKSNKIRMANSKKKRFENSNKVLPTKKINSSIKPISGEVPGKLVGFKVKKKPLGKPTPSIGFKTRSLSSTDEGTGVTAQVSSGGKISFNNTRLNFYGGGKFLIQISRDKDFSSTYFSQTISKWPFSLQVRDKGKYYWRIKKLGKKQWIRSSSLVNK